jgi:threonine dehydrogenase-like Zn-dependent dehydrogenase
VLQAHGYPVHQFGHHPEKLRLAAAAGVTTEISAGALPTAAYDWVVEATGNPEALRQAAAMTRPRGTLILKSTVHGLVSLDTAPLIVNELTLIGSRCGRFEAALPLLEPHIIRAEEMISARYPLRDAAQAFEHAARRGTLKVLLYP